MTARGSVLEGVSEQLMELLERQQAEIDALARAAEDRRSQLAAMLDRLQRDGSSESSMQTLEGLDEVRRWILEHAADARHEAVAMSPGGVQSDQSLRQGLALDREALARGVRLRSIYLTSATRWPTMREHVRTLTSEGAEYRTSPSLPMRMLIIDDDVALLPLDAARTGLGAIVVRSRATLVALRALFEATWDVAQPFGSSAASADQVSDQERLALAMLAKGARDQEVADALGVSLRTVRRMLSDLSGRLQARSRFQAGVHAVRAGWLAGPGPS